MVSVTVPVRGSIRETVSSCVFATQTAPAPTARAVGPCPTEVVPITAPSLAGSRRVTVLSSESVTQTLPAPAAIALGSFPTEVLATTSSLSASTPAMAPKVRPLHTEPYPVAMGFWPNCPNPSGNGATRTERTTDGRRKLGSSLTSLVRRMSPIHTPRASAATPPTVMPGEVVLTTLRSRGAICVTVSSPRFATHR